MLNVIDTAKQLRELAEQGLKSTISTSIIRINGQYLGGIDLSKCSLDSAYLRGCDLSNANLSHACLHGATLKNCRLTNANLEFAYGRATNLADADMANVNMKHARLIGANLTGCDFFRADLHGSTLEAASLAGVNWKGANVLEVIGIYSAFTPHMSSRADALYGAVVMNNGKLDLRLQAGCQYKTAAAIRARVNSTYQGIEAVAYLRAIDFIEQSFNADMELGNWDYLLTWDEDHARKAD